VSNRIPTHPTPSTKQREERLSSTAGALTAAAAKSANAQRAAVLEAARVKHREDMKKAIFHSNQRQWAFMYRNREVLQPFITQEVGQSASRYVICVCVLDRIGSIECIVQSGAGRVCWQIWEFVFLWRRVPSWGGFCDPSIGSTN